MSHAGIDFEGGVGASVSSLLYGRFELDRHLRITRVFDRSVYSLLGFRTLEGAALAALLKRRVNLEDFNKLQVFLNSLAAKQDLINSSSHQSPLDCLRVALPSESGASIKKYLRFEFLKDRQFHENGRWIVVLRDISKSVRLSRQIRRTTQRAQLKVNTMMSLLQFERDLIRDFLVSTTASLRNLLKYLDVKDDNQRVLRARIENIYCAVHQIKGDAAILNMSAISSKAHFIEGLLSKLHDRPQVSLNNMYALRRPVKSMIDSVKDIHGLFQQIVEGGWNNESKSGGDSMRRRIQYLVKRIADAERKQVVLVDETFQDSVIPLYLRRDLNSIVTQLVRNAVVHGIETVAEREAAHKLPYGCLHIFVQHRQDRLLLRIRDDGAGVDCERVRAVAARHRDFHQQRVQDWNKARLLQVLFHPGFSTRTTVDQNAGRGVGLDYIKQAVEKHGGSVNLRSVQGQFTEFILSFPND